MAWNTTLNECWCSSAPAGCVSRQLLLTSSLYQLKRWYVSVMLPPSGHKISYCRWRTRIGLLMLVLVHCASLKSSLSWHTNIHQTTTVSFLWNVCSETLSFSPGWWSRNASADIQHLTENCPLSACYHFKVMPLSALPLQRSPLILNFNFTQPQLALICNNWHTVVC